MEHVRLQHYLFCNHLYNELLCTILWKTRKISSEISQELYLLIYTVNIQHKTEKAA